MEHSGSIADRIRHYRDELPENVTLIAVSKFHPAEAIEEAYAAGQRDFGESRAPEFVAKAKVLPDDIRWHFIGHLQTNKVRMIMPYVAMIQSVDSTRLLTLINDEAQRIGRTVDVLLQVHVAAEETKTGFTPDELEAMAEAGLPASLSAIRVRGLMGMATNTDNKGRVDADFRRLHDLYMRYSNDQRIAAGALDTLSMGMSHDYTQALMCGSTMVRIGTDIFGERQY
ncbi:MAG: YggS family pyridoxal phosphate-dependent enzyme [Muribaculaceae bacterium]|nr:YggS family pyridoxal phosphate-dependent enzyme [Muribaculaceae bacterium]